MNSVDKSFLLFIGGFMLLLSVFLGFVAYTMQQDRQLFSQLIERGVGVNEARCAAFNKCSR